MSGERCRGKRKPAEVKAKVLDLLQSASDSKQLLEQLEELSWEQSFAGLTHVWGPLLYDRAPKIFRSFILRHFSTYIVEGNWRWRPVAWKGEVAERLELWLKAVDEADDVELFRRLYAWKHQGLSQKRAGAAWQCELLKRFRKAADRQARQRELSKLDQWYWLDEESAISLYQTDSQIAGPFILKHLPRGYSIFRGEKRKLWPTLSRLAKEKSDHDFYFKLYREQVPVKQWTAEALALCSSMQDTERLVEELRRRHPNVWTADLGDTYCQLLEVRGEEIFPYIIPELRKVARGWFRGSYERLIALALKQEWLELWAGLLRTCSTPKEYNAAVNEVLKLGTREAKRRLLLLAGIGQEWNFGSFGIASYRPLDDLTAVAVYGHYPELLRGPLRAQITPNWKNTYSKLLDCLIQNTDEELLDYLASRMVTFTKNFGDGKLPQVCETLADYYQKLQQAPEEFARRAAAVISQVPPYVFWRYDEVIRTNRLSRLLYERRPESYLACPEAVLDLLESPEIRAQILAYRILSLPDERARKIAGENLTILLGTLYRPIHRQTRLHAFRALKNAAANASSAERILGAAREACYLPDKRYPKDDLVELLAHLLHRYPELRTAQEEPVIYGDRVVS